MIRGLVYINQMQVEGSLSNTTTALLEVGELCKNHVLCIGARNIPGC